MVAFLIRRLLHGIWALWLIATLIFLLSRLLPGSFGAQHILGEGDGFYSKSTGSSREAAYQAYLQRTGQHLPLFYFSIGTSAEPDSLHTIFPESDRLLLQKLAWRYGDWHRVAAYFNSLKAINAGQPGQDQDQFSIRQLIRKLYVAAEPEIISTTAHKLRARLHGEQGSKELIAAAEAMITNSQPYRVLIPSFSWHGSHNQYHRWLMQLLQGDLGTSFRDNRAVTDVIRTAIGTTSWILLFSMIITGFTALQLGILFARRRGTKWRKALMPFLFFIDRIPVFILALLLLIVFASPDFLQLFPVYGMGYYQAGEQSWIQQLTNLFPFIVLPIVCLVTVNLPYLTNQFYRSLADVAYADFIKTAKAKGLSETKIIRKHMLRNALLPIITLLADFLPALVAGVVVIETIFAIPGIGRLLIDSVLSRDYPVIVGIVLVVALFKVLSHLISDLLYGLADPRIRLTS